MSLIKVMAQASKFRRHLRRAGGKIGLRNLKKRKGLRGGMWAKKQAISGAYSISALGAAGQMAKMNKIRGLTSTQRFGKGRALGHKAVGESRAHFAKRYPKTQFGIGATKVAGIGATGAWILNDKDMKA